MRLLYSVETGRPSTIPHSLLHNKKTDQFKIVQSGNFCVQCGRAALPEQTVNITFLIYIYDGINGVTKEFGILAHVTPIFCLTADLLAQRQLRRGVSAAKQPHFVQQLFRGEMSRDDLALLGDINHAFCKVLQKAAPPVSRRAA